MKQTEKPIIILVIIVGILSEFLKTTHDIPFTKLMCWGRESKVSTAIHLIFFHIFTRTDSHASLDDED